MKPLRIFGVLLSFLLLSISFFLLLSNLRKKVDSNKRATITWKPSSTLCTRKNCIYYEIFRNDCGRNNQEKLASGIYETTYIDKTVEAGKCYDYAVKACSYIECSEPTTIENVIIPNLPTRLYYYPEENQNPNWESLRWRELS